MTGIRVNDVNDVEMSGQDLCVVYVDMGTTNTRAWLCYGKEILARAHRPVGVRHTARDGTNHRIQEALRGSIHEIRSQTKSPVPVCVAAAGMIGSPLGLVELRQVSAPASLQKIAAGSRWFEFPEISDLPVFLVPGVRSGPPTDIARALESVDVMRGEETLCAGLIRLDLIKLPSVVLNLGSHWKAIQLDEQGRVHFSVTSLSGELIHSAQTQTVLASSVSKDRPAQLAESWIQAGMSEQRRSGLSRALFCVRLLELACEGTAEDRFSFLLGAFIATDLDALIARGMLGRDNEVSIVGTNDLAAAWRDVLARNSIRALVLTADEVERAFLAGLNGILVESLGTQRIEELKTVNS